MLETHAPPAAQVWVDGRFAPALRALLGKTGETSWIADPARCPGAAGRPAGAGRAPSAVIALPGRSERLHLRALRHGGWWAGLWGTRLLGPARGWREIGAAAVLRDRGAPVPRPVCLAARPAHPGWQVAVGQLFVENAVDARSWLGGSRDERTVVRAARAAGRAVRRFHDCGGRHRDLHLGNLLLRPPPGGTGGDTLDGPFDVWVVDLDGARADAPPSPARRMGELMRLWRSARKAGLASRLGRRGPAAFFAAYCGGDRALRGAMRRRLALLRLYTALHALRYT